jgi:hypothetical protein
MTKKEIKYRETQNEFIAKLQQCVNAFDNADKLLDEIDDFIKNEMPNETSKFDSEQQDYLHILENYELNDSQLICIGRKLEANRNVRKNWHNIYAISTVWNEHKAKIYNKNSRIFLREILAKNIKSLDSDWKFRVLSEDEVKSLLKEDKEETTKKGRPSKFSTAITDKIFTDYENGVSPKNLSTKYDIKLPTLYAMLKRYKNKVA